MVCLFLDSSFTLSALSLVVTPPTQTRVSAAEHKELAKEIINIFLSPLAMFSRGDYSLETRRSAVGALKDVRLIRISSLSVSFCRFASITPIS